MIAGGGAAIGYNHAWRARFLSVVQNIHFLLRENDALSAKAALEKRLP